MNKLIPLIIPIFFSQLGISQDQNLLKEIGTALIKNETYAPGKTYFYKAVKLNNQGDTISNEVVKMVIPKSLNHNSDRIYFIWKTNTSEEDIIRLTPKSEETVERPWIQNDTTTMRLNEEDLYIHPLRENQYYQAEIAPHPTIKFNKTKNNSYSSTIVILKAFGIYNMKKSISTFQLISDTPIQFQQFTDCYLIKAASKVEEFTFGAANASPSQKSPKSLDSTAEFLVSKSKGFVKLSYLFYDDEQLILELLN